MFRRNLLMRNAILPFLLLLLSGCLTPIQKAAQKGDLHTLRQLINSGADPNEGAPLTYAVSMGKKESVIYLLNEGADPNGNSFGHLLLFWAIFYDQWDIARILVKRGADAESAAADYEAHGMATEGKEYFLSYKVKADRLRRMAGIETVPTAVATASPAATTSTLRPEPIKIKSDVDTPQYRTRQQLDDFALVIGIENYSDLPEARFAERDAAVVAKHFEKLGVPLRNIIHLSGIKATGSGLKKYLETWLPKNVKASSRVYFYFSGHGAPDTTSGTAYLVPFDGDPNFLKDTAYPVKRLYKNLGDLRAKEVIVVLDACFSGAGGRSVLAKGARPLVTKVDTVKVPHGKITLLTATSGNQITTTLEDQGHGMFTYFFLKGLNGEAKDAKGRITAKSLFDYLKPRVQDEARRQNREQTPTIHTKSNVVLRTD